MLQFNSASANACSVAISDSSLRDDKNLLRVWVFDFAARRISGHIDIRAVWIIGIVNQPRFSRYRFCGGKLLLSSSRNARRRRRRVRFWCLGLARAGLRFGCPLARRCRRSCRHRTPRIGHCVGSHPRRCFIATSNSSMDEPNWRGCDMIRRLNYIARGPAAHREHSCAG
jgi:hypothetical protein